MTRALIGHTGFVGGNLLRQSSFEAVFNSRNIEDIRGREFDEIVCAGAPAEKWRANAEPERDRAALERLMRPLEEVRAGRFVLISTVDVYPSPAGADETTAIDRESASTYGRHRHKLEEFVAGRFEALIVRLPALFGPGLKKNAIYDLLHDNEVEKIDARGVFQFYSIDRLSRDLEIARQAGLRLLNVATPPMTIGSLAERFFGRTLHAGDGSHARYDVRSIHSGLWSRDDGYLYSSDQVLADLGEFVEHSR